VKPLLIVLLICAASQLLPAVTPVRPLPFPNGGKEGDIKVDSTGRIHLVWLQNDSLFYASSSDQGQTFSTPIQVNAPDEPAFGHMFRVPEINLGREGTIHVIWYPQQGKLDKNDWGVRYARLAKGETKFSAPINLGHAPSDNYSLASNGKGQVAVMWTTGPLWVALSKDDGETFTPAHVASSRDRRQSVGRRSRSETC